MLRNGNKYLLMLVSIIMLTACISQSRTSFIPPQDRESLLAEQPWPHNGFVAIHGITLKTKLPTSVLCQADISTA